MLMSSWTGLPNKVACEYMKYNSIYIVMYNIYYFLLMELDQMVKEKRPSFQNR